MEGLSRGGYIPDAELDDPSARKSDLLCIDGYHDLQGDSP